MINAATLANLARKAPLVDAVQMIDGKPIPSWIELNVTELCNRSAGHPRACQFCPRFSPDVYPNQHLQMSLGLATKIGDELEAIVFEGTVVLSGFGEPLLHPRLPELIACLGAVRVEIVTNGDRLTVSRIKRLIEAGANYILVSLYDGPHQVEPLERMFAEAGCGPGVYALRDRWHGPEYDFGLKLTNRSGTTDVGNQPPIDRSHPCLYPSYEMMVDWNGDVLLCVQDWTKKIRFGNLNDQSLLEVWWSSALHKRRMRLIAGERDMSPCSSCNADGCLHGADHAAAWQTHR